MSEEPDGGIPPLGGGSVGGMLGGGALGGGALGGGVPPPIVSPVPPAPPPIWKPPLDWIFCQAPHPIATRSTRPMNAPSPGTP